MLESIKLIWTNLILSLLEMTSMKRIINDTKKSSADVESDIPLKTRKSMKSMTICMKMKASMVKKLKKLLLEEVATQA